MSSSEPLLNEIRAARPVAPAELRERIRLVAAQEPAPEPLLARLPRRLDLRRFLLVATPATLAVAVVAAGVIGLTRPDERTDGATAGGGTAAVTSGSAGAEEESLDSARQSAPPLRRARTLRSRRARAASSATTLSSTCVSTISTTSRPRPSAPCVWPARSAAMSSR